MSHKILQHVLNISILTISKKKLHYCSWETLKLMNPGKFSLQPFY